MTTALHAVDDTALETLLDQARMIVYHAVGFHDDDLAQEAREAIWQATTSYRDTMNCTLTTWAHRKARWRVIDAYRARTGHRRTGPRPTLETIEGLPQCFLEASDGDIAETVCQTVGTRQMLHTLNLDGLSDRDRQIVAAWMAQMPPREIARTFGLTPSRISQIVCRFTATSAAALRKVS